MDEYAKMPEFPVFVRGAADDSLPAVASLLGDAAADTTCSAMGEVSQALAALTESARILFEAVCAASADRGVAMADLAPVVAGANLLERAASAVTIAATAGYARRESHDHLDDIAVPVESIRAAGFTSEWAASELGQLLRLSPRTAGGRVATAAQLSARFPRVLQAVAQGAIEAWQADKVIGLLMEAGADDETARAVDAWLGPRLATGDPTRILALTRYALGRIAPHLLPDRARKNRARRAIERWEVEPGLSEITARMPTHQAAAIWSAASTLAKEYQGLHPELTLDQARLDAFVDLALANVTVTTHVTLGIPVVTSAYVRTGEAPTDLLDEPADIDGTDPSYHCDTEHDPDLDPPEEPWTDEGAESEGADQHRYQHRCDAQPPARDSGAETGCRGHSSAVDEGCTTCPPGERDRGYRGPGTAPLRVPAWAAHPDGPPPACVGERERAWWLSGVHLPGIGYVPPDIVQALTAQLGTLISVALLDAHRGILLSHATDAYRPTKAISALVATRDGQCRFFGCTRPATGCDLDHAIAHHRHGPTSGQNLAPLCRRHHRAKQRREWTYLLDPDTGAAWWINSRTGSMRTTLPAVPAGSLDPPLTPAGPPPPAHHEDDRLPALDDDTRDSDVPPF